MDIHDKMYQIFLDVLEFNPEIDIIKIDGQEVKVYKWAGTHYLDNSREALKELEDE